MFSCSCFASDKFGIGYRGTISMVKPESCINMTMPITLSTIIIAMLLQQQLLSAVATAQMQTSNLAIKMPTSLNLPLSKGYVDGKIRYFLATDASDNKVAAAITESTGFKVNFAPTLAMIPASARGQGYDFLNGVKGDGSFGFQTPVSNAVPGEKGYSPLVQLNFVRWNPIAKPAVLKSVAEIMNAQKNGQITIINTNIIINSPVVK
jgi:hypothetical protein